MEEPKQKWEGVPFRLPVEEELIERVSWLIRLRWFAALGVVATTLVVGVILGLPIRQMELFLVGGIIAAYNAALHQRLKALRGNPSAGVKQFSDFASLQFFMDWLGLIFLVHYSGGIESPVIFYFIFHAIIASILIPPRACYFHATVGVILVGTLALLEFYEIIPHVALPGFLLPHYQQPFYVMGTLFFFASAIYVSIYLATSITRRLWARTRELARLKQRLESAYYKTQTLYDIAKAATSTLNFTEALNTIAQQATKAMKAKACSIRLLDEERRQLWVGAAYGLSEEYLSKGPVDLDKSLVDRGALRGKAVAVLDVTKDPGFQYPEEARKEGIRSVLCVPLSVREQTIGVLRLYTGEIHRFTEEEIDFLSTLASQGAVAIENARTYQRLEDLEQAKSDFVFTVAHELKAPVAAIQSILRVLMEGYAGEIFQKQKELIGRAERRLIALQSLIRDLLALGALKGALPETKKVDVILNGVVNRVVDAIQAEVEEKNIELSVEVPHTLLTIKGTDDDLERLLGNLLENAVKYTLPGGKVRLQLSLNDNAIRIVVSDTGIGISPESMPRIFEEFYRAKNAKEMGQEGTGLGLSLVKHIVDRYRGEIGVESKLGEGSTFTIALPRE
ncbi:MAG: GAF domain-containing protein [Deltaproteobacteria bacterium]|nr:GAF domain-containing protein [Deltaproteobacteria bacterium]